MSDRYRRASSSGVQSTHRLAIPSIALRLVLLTTLVALGGCGNAPSPTPAPTPPPAPTPTPDPHLGNPTTANLVYAGLVAAGLRVVGNGANTGAGGAEPRRRINATLKGWPLIIEEYSSSTALAKATKIGPSSRPRPGDPPYVFIGLNIRIEFGPKVADSIPPDADGPAAAAAADLAAVLDAVIGPIVQVAVVPVSLPTLAAPAGSAAPGADIGPVGGAPTAIPTASPAPPVP